MKNYAIYSLVFIFTACMITFSFTRADSLKKPKQSPLNPAFSDFLQNKDFTILHAYDEDGHATGYIPSPVPPEQHIPGTGISAASNTDPMYDMRDPDGDGNQSDSLLTPVKDQGSCGACWSFASYGSLESQIKKFLNETHDFSENNLINLHGFDLSPCGGGTLSMTAAYLARYSGPVNEVDDPFSQYPLYCSDCTPVKYIDRIIFFPVRYDVYDNQYIKDAVFYNGGIYTTMYWNSFYYNDGENTYYYDDPDTNHNEQNHAVVIVGWDDNKAVTNAPGNGAWIVRNSWGKDWGEDGYFYVSYYDENIAFESVAAFFDLQESQLDFNTVHYYDTLGYTASVGFDSTVGWGANWFVPEDDEVLTAVGFFATDSPTQYEIYIYDNFNGSSFSTLLASKTGSVSFRGWYTVSLDSPVSIAQGDGFGVVMKFINTDDIYPVAIERPISGYSSGATAHAGESYVSYDGIYWSDLTYSSDNSNVCIKAFTLKNLDFLSGKVSGDVQQDVTIRLFKLGCGSWDIHDTAITGTDGNYSFQNLPEGTYKIEAEYPGATFDPAFYEGIDIPYTNPSSYDFLAACGCGGC